MKLKASCVVYVGANQLTAVLLQQALLYNDRSPLENHHLSAAFTLLKARTGAA